MSGYDQWLSFGLGSGVSALPVWVAGALAALLFFAGVLAFARASQAGRTGTAWRVALLVIGAGLMWVLMDSLSGRDQAAARRMLDARAAELTLRAIAPGSPLACLEAVANETVEAACEKSLFASPETIAAAVAYVDARLMLLADSLELAANDRAYAASIERQRRAIEADRFGVVAHVLTTRGCTASECPAFKLLRDPRRVASNLRERNFDAHVVLHASAWRTDSPAPVAVAPAVAPPGSGPSLASVPGAATTGSAPTPGRYDFPSAASIPAISIMSSEPPLPNPEADAPANAAPAARPPAQRRQTVREAPPPAQQPLPSVPLPPPGTTPSPR